MIRRLRSLALAALVLALLAAGCGTATDSSQEFTGAEGDVAQAIEDLEQAASDDESRRVCTNLLATALVRSFEQRGQSCSEAVQQAFDDTDTTNLEVDSVRVTGDTARARVQTGRDADQLELVELVRERDAWRISRFGGVVEG